MPSRNPSWSVRTFAAAFVVAAVAIPVATARPAAGADEPKGEAAKVERGAYLVTLGGCNHCHTPMKMGPQGPEHDSTRLLSGHPESLPLPDPPGPAGPWIWHGAASNTAFAGPWGVSISPNLTPDEETGIGKWSEERFVRAMRTGKHYGGGRPILPPMPATDIGKLTDEDLSAMWAYLRSIPAVKNQAPDSQPAPPSPAAK